MTGRPCHPGARRGTGLPLPGARLAADGPGRGGAFQHRLGHDVEGQIPGLVGRGVELLAEDVRERGEEGVADGPVVRRGLRRITPVG